MPYDKTRLWQTTILMHAYNEEVASTPGAPLDLQTWLYRHFQCWPTAFAYEDWSGHQPVIRKIRLIKLHT